MTFVSSALVSSFRWVVELDVGAVHGGWPLKIYIPLDEDLDRLPGLLVGLILLHPGHDGLGQVRRDHLDQYGLLQVLVHLMPVLAVQPPDGVLPALDQQTGLFQILDSCWINTPPSQVDPLAHCPCIIPATQASPGFCPIFLGHVADYFKS